MESKSRVELHAPRPGGLNSCLHPLGHLALSGMRLLVILAGVPIYASWCGWSSHWPPSPGHQSPLDSSRFGHLIHCVPFYAGWTHEVIACILYAVYAYPL